MYICLWMGICTAKLVNISNTNNHIHYNIDILGTPDTLNTLDTLDTLVTLDTLDTLVTFDTLDTHDSLNTLDTLDTLLDTFGSLDILYIQFSNFFRTYVRAYVRTY